MKICLPDETEAMESRIANHPSSRVALVTALQGHANKNKDLMTASGAITLRGPELYDELQADIEAVSREPN
jgi:hypothetical protein